MTKNSIEKQLQGYRLTMAEVNYHLPDYPDLLQSFIWQTMDIAPTFPSIRKFLRHWEDNLEGKLHSAKVMSTSLIKPSEFRLIDHSWQLH
ncbi:MAG: Usg family protein [Rhodospirillales bacterium]|nr:Usg family protein [Rhodospirillales bacterium]